MKYSLPVLVQRGVTNVMACKTRQPKWLELAEGEVYLKSIMARQGLFVILFVAIIILAFVMLVALIAGDADEIVMPMTMVFGSMTSVMAIGVNKLHLTNQRLLMEIKHKHAGEIRLDEIKAIQVTKLLLGGKVLIVPAKKGVGGIEITAVKPYQFAEEIQQLSAENDEQSNAGNNYKGEVR